MLRNTITKAKKSWAFAVAAASLPLTYVLLFPCFGTCGGCPTGGLCLLSAPLLITMVIVAKGFVRIKKGAQRIAKAVVR